MQVSLSIQLGTNKTNRSPVVWDQFAGRYVCIIYLYNYGGTKLGIETSFQYRNHLFV